jgi:putative acetyltransferase
MHSADHRYRIPSPDDAEAMVDVHFAAVHAVAHEHYPEHLLHAWSPVPDNRRRAWLAEVIASPTTLSCLAESSGHEVLGFGFVDTDSGVLKALYVHPKATGRGLGKNLLLHLENQCRSLGLVALTLNASYNAERFYRNNGYTVQGPSVQVLGNGESMCAVSMMKSLVTDS